MLYGFTPLAWMLYTFLTRNIPHLDSRVVVPMPLYPFILPMMSFVWNTLSRSSWVSSIPASARLSRLWKYSCSTSSAISWRRCGSSRKRRLFSFGKYSRKETVSSPSAQFSDAG